MQVSINTRKGLSFPGALGITLKSICQLCPGSVPQVSTPFITGADPTLGLFLVKIRQFRITFATVFCICGLTINFAANEKLDPFHNGFLGVNE